MTFLHQRLHGTVLHQSLHANVLLRVYIGLFFFVFLCVFYFFILLVYIWNKLASNVDTFSLSLSYPQTSQLPLTIPLALSRQGETLNRVSPKSSTSYCARPRPFPMRPGPENISSHGRVSQNLFFFKTLHN